MACCLSPSCCPGRRSARRPVTKSTGRRSSKSVASSTTAEPPTPRTSTVVPDVVDRLRRRFCQDDGSGTGNDVGVSQSTSPCRCCRRCLGEDGGQQAADTEPDRSPVPPPPRSSPTPAKSDASGTTPRTTQVGDADFMTLFFRNCERIVLDNAAAIHEMLSAPAHDGEEEQRQNTGDEDWTSNKTEPSSSTNTVEQRRCLTNDDEDDNLRSDIASVLTGCEFHRTDDADTSTSCGRTEGSVERLIAPANSPVSAGSLLSSSISDDILLTTTCVCSPSTKVSDVADDGGQFVRRRRPSVSGQSPAAVNVNWTADRWGSLNDDPTISDHMCDHVRLPCPVYERRRLYERTVDTDLCLPLCGLFPPGSSWSIV